MITIAEGEVGFAKGHEELKYPSVTSCLTITCVLHDGAKYGGHMSVKTKEGKLENTFIPPELQARMKSDGGMQKVKKVWVVGALDCWSPQLRPTTAKDINDTKDRIQTSQEETMKSAAKRLAQVLGLHHLDCGKAGPDMGEDHFVFYNSASGDITFGEGDSEKVKLSAERLPAYAWWE